jgi:hypothetical protein
LIAVHSDGHDGKRDVIAKAMWTTLRELAETGPTQAELDHERAGANAALEDPRNLDSWLASMAWRRLSGLPATTPGDFLSSLADLSPGTVQGWARAGLDSALLGLPIDVDISIDGLPDRTEEFYPSADPVQGEAFGRRLLAISPRDLRVVVGEGGISQTCFKHTVTAPWDRVVGVATADGVRSLVLENGQAILLTRRHLKDSDRLFEMVDGRLGHLMFERTREDILGG